MGGDIDIRRTRTSADIAAATDLVWEFFQFLRVRYPDMLTEIDEYIAEQDVAGRLEAFSKHCAPPHGECFLATVNGAAQGLVMLRPRDGGGAEMNRMFVRDAARRLGLGRRLVEAVIEEAGRLGYDTIWLDALHRHVEALPLYESFGFLRYTIDQGDPRIVHMKLILDGH